MLKWKVEKKFEHGSKILSPTSKTGKFMSALMSETHLTLWQDALETLISDPTNKRANNFFSTKNLIFFSLQISRSCPSDVTTASAFSHPETNQTLLSK